MSRQSAIWSELGIPDYENVFKVGLKDLIKRAETRLEELDQYVPVDFIDQKDFLAAVVIALKAVVRFANSYQSLAKKLVAEIDDKHQIARLENIEQICKRVPEHPPETLQEALQSFFFLHVG